MPAAGRADRGETTLAPAVFERIAARVAGEVDGIVGEVRTAGASASVDDGGVVLDLTVNVAYPQPAGQVAERVRDRVIARVGELTGRPVRQVNITVAELVVPEPPRRPRVR